MSSSGKFEAAAALDMLANPVCVKSQHSEFLYANEAFCELMGKSRDEVVGRPISDVTERSIAAFSSKTDQCLFEGEESKSCIVNFEASDGSKRVLLAKKKLLELADGDQGILCTLTDITDFVQYEEELEEKHRELRRQQNKLKELATLDPLTGIYNRRCFYDQAEELLTYARMGDLEVGVLMVDLDSFKKLNDTYGHAAGDQVLINFTQTMTKCLRSSDVCARIGGEEFAVLLPDANVNTIESVAERIRKMTAETMIDYEGNTISVTTSVGCSMWRSNDKSIDAAMGRADCALYKAKSTGRNRVCFDDELTSSTAKVA